MVFITVDVDLFFGDVVATPTPLVFGEREGDRDEWFWICGVVKEGFMNFWGVVGSPL